jgi:two-component system, NarL family, response regulator NreC
MAAADDARKPIRIVLVDDHSVVRAGLRMLLQAHDGFEVLGEAGTGREGLELVEIKRPDVVVLDLGLPDIDGLELVDQMQHKGRGTRVLVLSMQDDPARVEQAFSAGADGYLVKEAAEGELVAAIEQLMAGERYLYPPLGAAMVRAATAPPSDPLTEREREIVRLLALGHTNAEIAKLVHLSVRTIETHRSHAMTKLRVSSRAEMVRWALEHGLLDEARNT